MDYQWFKSFEHLLKKCSFWIWSAGLFVTNKMRKVDWEDWQVLVIIAVRMLSQIWSCSGVKTAGLSGTIAHFLCFCHLAIKLYCIALCCGVCECVCVCMRACVSSLCACACVCVCGGGGGEKRCITAACKTEDRDTQTTEQIKSMDRKKKGTSKFRRKQRC